jgi:hypothetical protein
MQSLRHGMAELILSEKNSWTKDLSNNMLMMEQYNYFEMKWDPWYCVYVCFKMYVSRSSRYIHGFPLHRVFT